MRIKIEMSGVSFTSVPDEEELSKDKVYYVYEWYIKETNKVFYVGKGKGKRYKQDKNDVFLMLKNAYECDVRFVQKDLTEYEALVLEEKLFAKREAEGHVLANVQTPNATGVYQIEQDKQFMVAPKIKPNRVESAYFGMSALNFDEVKLEKLLASHIKKQSYSGLGELYAGKSLNPRDCEKLVDDYKQRIRTYVEDKKGRMFKTEAKSVKGIIIYGYANIKSYQKYKQKKYDVYHMVDVFHFINNH